jgi:hypothetical protein
MKFTIYSFLAISLFFISCSKDSEQKSSSQSMSSANNLTIDNIISLPSNYQYKYIIQNEEDLSYQDNSSSQLIKRIQIRIAVPPGLDKTELENNIKHATKTIYEKHKPNGISVLVYENGDNVMSAYTVAKSDFAPNGDWSKISISNKLDNYKVQMDINEAYFKPKASTIAKGLVVKLFCAEKYDRNKKEFVPATKVSLSNSVNSWVEEDIIGYAKNNSSAKILDIHKEKLPDGSDFIRYKVLVSIKGKDLQGWVHGEEVK